jgi:hypothetical protein
MTESGSSYRPRGALARGPLYLNELTSLAQPRRVRKMPLAKAAAIRQTTVFATHEDFFTSWSSKAHCLDASCKRFTRSRVATVWRPFTLFEARGINFAIVV